jgi:two-component system, LytTR family, sensor kinase
MNRTRQIFLHTSIWISILLFFIYIGSNGKYNYNTIVVIIYFGLINILVFYLNYLFILPKFLNRKKYWWCAISMILLVLAAGLVKYGLASIYKDFVLIHGPKKVQISFWDYYLGAVFVSVFFMFLSTALKFMVDWFINEKVKGNLENEKLTAELAFLKSQINPHFLFNSLNNIYSLAYQKSAQTPEAILKLSEIMRYMLYESNDNMVDLAKEIRYLENYIELQKLRFKDQSFVQFEISGDPENQVIMPLVLISFVENAFKHGVATDVKNPILITIKIEHGKLFFQVINKKGDFNKDVTGGIGLLNVQRRLDLVYKDKYNLDIENTEESYTCVLNLNL